MQMFGLDGQASEYVVGGKGLGLFSLLNFKKGRVFYSLIRNTYVSIDSSSNQLLFLKFDEVFKVDQQIHDLAAVFLPV